MSEANLDTGLRKWLEILNTNRAQCVKLVEELKAHGNPTPGQGDLNSLEGPPAKYSSNDLKVESTKTWLLRDAPINAQDLIAAYNPETTSFWSPEPSNVRLTDAGVFIARLTLPLSVRRAQLCHDFDTRGEIRRNRVPIAPTVILTANGVNWLPVYQHKDNKHQVILTGGHNDAGWLLGDVPGLKAFPKCFHAGLIVAPDDVVASGCLKFQLPGYKSPDQLDPRYASGIYNIAQESSVKFRQREDVEGYCLVPGDQGFGVIKMADLPGFSPYIDPAMPSDVGSKIDVDPNRVASLLCQIQWGFHEGETTLISANIPNSNRSQRKRARGSSTTLSAETAEDSATSHNLAITRPDNTTAQAPAVVETFMQGYIHQRATVSSSSNHEVAPQELWLDHRLAAISPTLTKIQRPGDASTKTRSHVTVEQQLSIMSTTLKSGLLGLFMSGRTQTTVYRDFDAVQKQKTAAMMFPFSQVILLHGRKSPFYEESFVDMLLNLPLRRPFPPAHLAYIAIATRDTKELNATIDASGYWSNIRQLEEKMKEGDFYTFETEAERSFFALWLGELFDCYPAHGIFQGLTRSHPDFMEHDVVQALLRQLEADDKVTSYDSSGDCALESHTR